MSTIVADLADLLKDVPPGAWAAISERGHTVLAFGADAQAVYSEALEKGETTPLMVRVPEPEAAMFF